MLVTERRLKKKELEQKPGIKAQHAVFRALQSILARANTGWEVEETEPGSRSDRQGIDIWLVNKAQGIKRILDVSLRNKPDKEGTVVRVRSEWFVENPDGSWTLKAEYEQTLVRALLPTMSAPHVHMGMR